MIGASLRELEEKRGVLRSVLHDTGELQSRLSEELAALDVAQLRGDRTLTTVERIRFLGGRQVEAQRRRILIGNQLDEVNEQINRETVTV